VRIEELPASYANENPERCATPRIFTCLIPHYGNASLCTHAHARAHARTHARTLSIEEQSCVREIERSRYRIKT
jgi:hypothetical protein